MPDAFLQKEGRSVPVCVAACVGYGLLSLVCQLTVWGGLRLSDRTGLELLPLLTRWTIPLLVSLAATLIVVGVVALWRSSGRESPRLISAMSVGACLFLLCGYGIVVMMPNPASPLVSVGVVVLGVGLGVLLAAWAALFSRFSSRDVTALVLLSLIVSAALSLMLGSATVRVLEVAYAFSVCLSTAVLVVLSVTNKRAGEDEDRQTPNETIHGAHFEWTAPQDTRPPARRLVREVLKAVRNPLFCAAAIAFAVAITRVMTLRTSPAVVGASGQVCVAIGAAAFLFALYGPHAKRVSRLTIPSLFRILFPLVATLLLVLSIGGDGLGPAVSAAVFALYAIMASLVIPVSIDTSLRKNSSTTAVYGLFSGIVHGVFAGATSIGVYLFARGGEFDATTSLVGTLLVLYVLAMAYTLVQRHSSGGETHAVALKEASALDEAPAVSSGVDIAGAGPDEDLDSIDLRCLVLAEQHRLSPRETEVLRAFAHGRNVSYLAEQLCLSSNTIRSHSKTLYTKLGVHGKQELINLVDEVSTAAIGQ